MMARLMKMTAVTMVQTTSNRLLPCEYVARVAADESRYFHTTQPRPICAAANAIPTTTMVIMDWRSTAPPCSEMDSGNHQCLLTNIPTDPSVMSQMASPRTRPIEVSFVSQTLVCVDSH